MFPAMQEKGPGHIPISSRFRVDALLNISNGLIEGPFSFSHFKVSTISLNTGAAIGSETSPCEFVCATDKRASSKRPWWTSQRGDSGLLK